MTAALILFVLTLGLSGSATAVSADIVVSQVYGGGGNSGATLTNDFIELFNRGSTPVDVSAWSVQYASAAGTTWQITPLSGTIQPGRYYLVQEAAGAGGTVPLPAPDATGSIAMGAAAGKVALVTSQTGLACGADCDSNPAVRDFVGYGTTANDFEGTGPTPAPSNTTAVVRAGAGCTDTDSNSSDFASSSPTPRNSASPATSCVGDTAPGVSTTSPPDGATDVAVDANISITFSEAVNVSGSWFSISCTSSGSHSATVSGGPTTFTLDPDTDFMAGEQCTVTVVAGQVADQDANDPPDSMAADHTFSFTTAVPSVPIYTLQGTGATSPVAGTTQTTTGVVTAMLGNGFFVQDAAGDGTEATSDGIFVFGGSFARQVAPGDLVRVTGTLVEFTPPSAPRSLTVTEFSPTTSVTKIGTAPLPAPVVISNRPDVVIDPDGIVSFEQLEGMLVSIDNPRVAGPTNDFGEFVTAASGDQANMTPGGNFVLRPLGGGAVDYNPERILVDDEARQPGGTGSGTRINAPMPALTVGDTASGDIVGPLDYQFSNHRVQATTLVSSVLTGSAPAVPAANLRDAATFEGRIASFNVENLFDCVDAPGKADDHPTCNATALTALNTQLAKLATGFESELEKPDIVIVEETENAEVLTGDPVTGFVPGTTLAPLLDRVSGNWDAVAFDASDERGIEVAFAFNTDRVTLHDAFLATSLVPDGGLFSGSPTIRAGREPLVGVFSIGDVDDLVVIGNHFKSKGGPQFGVDPLEAGDDPLYGAFQPPIRWTEVQLRHAQADYVRDLVDLLLEQDSERRIVVGGDLNDFEFGEPGEGTHTVQRITQSATAPLTNVVPLVPAVQRYTFIFEGNSQVLDHLLLNREMESLRRDQAIAHFNTDYPSAFGTNPAHPLRSSDHDPLVAYFCTDLTPCARAEIEELIDDLEALLDANPDNAKLRDRIEDVIGNLRQALRTIRNDRQGAAGELEGAAGDLEAAVQSKLLPAAQGNAFLDRIAGAARLLAVEAIEEAEDADGDTMKLRQAKQALAQGDERLDALRFKAAIAKYEDAIAKAESA